MASQRSGRVLLTVAAAISLLVPSASVSLARQPGSTSPALRLSGRDATPTTPRFRGRVDVSALDRAGPESPDVAGAPVDDLTPRGAGRSVELGEGVSAAPVPQFATTNTTPPAPITRFGAASTTVASLPELMVAVGPDHVVQSTTLGLRIQSRLGVGATMVSHPDFFGFPDWVGNRSHRVYFDASHNRWVAMEVSYDCIAFDGATRGHGYLDFAISDSANPRKSWSIFYYQYNDKMPFEPAFGNSTDKFVFTNGVRGLTECGGTAETQPWQLRDYEWSEYLLHGTFTGELFELEPTPTQDFVRLLPAVQTTATTERVHIAAQTIDPSVPPVDPPEPAARHVWHVVVTGPVPGSTLLGYDLSDEDNIVPPWTGSWAWSVAWRNNRLVVALDERCIPPDDIVITLCVRVTDLNTSTVPASRRQDFILAAKGTETHSPGVVLSANGDLYVVYTRYAIGAVTGGGVIRSYVVRQRASDAAASVSIPTTIISGTPGWEGFYVEGLGLAADPLIDSAVWVTDAAPTSTGWASQVAELNTSTGDTYVPIAPLRILDTRTATGLGGGFVANIPRTFNVAGAGTIPANAVAITGNVTVAGQSGAGYLSVGPTAIVNPTSSTLNFPVGDSRANNLTLPLNAAGDLAAVYKAGAGKTTHVILDVTGYFLADDTGATYHPVAPARVLDSRPAYNIGLSGKFVANTPRSFQVSGHAGVPAGALAITGNLTVVGQSKAGYVSLTPTPNATPATSTINFPLGDTRANGVTVPLSGTGSLSAVFKASGGSTDLILDVTGYYLAGASGLRFYPLNPGRIMDTRFNTLTQLYGPFAHFSPRTLVVGGHFAVPGDALAVAGNLTVVGQTRPGYVSITQEVEYAPSVSTINFPLGDVRANGVTVPLGDLHSVAIVYLASAGAKTHLILDLTGYFR